tara:strand:+ start:631 stop:1482 length:852 start_codon:yes stop_codon:yes gene_type:complete
MNNFKAATEILIKKGLISNQDLNAASESSSYSSVNDKYFLQSESDPPNVIAVFDSELIDRWKYDTDFQPFANSAVVFKRKSDDVITYIEASKVNSFKRRQLDNGWGYAIAHLLPIVPLYYAINRRTITPIIYLTTFVLCEYLLGFIVLFISGALGDNPLGIFFAFLAFLIYVLGFCFYPFVARLGIKKARDYAKQRLLEVSDEFVPDQQTRELSTSQSSPLKETGEIINKTISKATKSISQITESKDEIDDIEVKLKKIKNMFDNQLISEKEYLEMRRKILNL